MKAIIAAAGTGGHINPGIAIANKIMQEEPDSEIIFIGTKRGLENDLVPRAGYELKTVDSYGISRSLSIKNIKRLIKTLGAIRSSKNIIKEFKPDIVIGTGGYICISVCKAAKKLKVPYVIHESNVLPGISTKLLAKKAAKVLVGFKETREKLPKTANIIVTGTPTKVRKLELTEKEVSDRRKELGFDDKKPIVLVFGGSQGAQSINTAMCDIIKEVSKGKKINYQLMWATGPKQFDEAKLDLKLSNIDIENINKGIKVVPYIYDMESVMNVVDLLVCRSGAMTVTEIEKVGKPAIFIPYPYAAENHQEYNARALENVKAAKVILDKELSATKLNEMIEDLVKDKETLIEMGENSHAQSMDHVKENIYTEIKLVK